jgi:multiple sugar transport system ATP-binding protein
MAEVRFEQATKFYAASEAPAVDALDLRIGDGEFMVLVGPSGSGKSTALRMLAGLEEVDGGAIFIGERDVTDIEPKHRDAAMVFQNYSLYPYLDVAANIAFPLKMARVKAAERNRRVQEIAELLDLLPYLKRKPSQLSGGQRQRVAMGRAIVREPSVFLMDEPLSNLDAQLRVQMRAEIAALQARLGVTTVFVTHDQVEAMTMGHRVSVLKDGRLQQCDTPRVLYDHPANVFVARFIGSPSMSLCTVPLGQNGTLDLGGARVALPSEVATALAERGAGDVVVGLRPECLHLGTEGVPAQVQVVEELGADAYAFCVGEIAGQEMKLIARADARHPPAIGERVTLQVAAGEVVHLFDPGSGERLSG